MPYINSTKFGEIVIDNKKYGQVLISDNEVFERDDKKLHQLFGTTHQIGDWEIEQLLRNNPEIVVVGTGQSGILQLEKPFLEKMKQSRVQVIAKTTPKAMKKYNHLVKQGRTVNALIHTTC